MLSRTYRSKEQALKDAGDLDEQLERATGKKREKIATWPDPDSESLLTTEQKRTRVERRRERNG